MSEMKTYDTKEFLSKRIKGMSGVYLLIDENDVIIYVGSSMDLQKRIYSHKISDKEFCKVGIMPCFVDGNLELEAEMIVKHNPKLNVTLPKTSEYITRKGAYAKLLEELTLIIDELPVVFSRGRQDFLEAKELEFMISSMKAYAISKLKECK